MLIGNKSDLEAQRQISYEEAAKFAFDNDMGYQETSAKTGENVQKSFTIVIDSTAALLTSRNLRGTGRQQQLPRPAATPQTPALAGA